jgi:hypothetical protein
VLLLGLLQLLLGRLLLLLDLGQILALYLALLLALLDPALVVEQLEQLKLDLENFGGKKKFEEKKTKSKILISRIVWPPKNWRF